MLYMQRQLSQKEIAAKVGVAEKTITAWKDKYLWEELRKSLLTSKSQLLSFYYNVLDKINQKIEEENLHADTKLADVVVKYTAAINNLETETSVAQLMDAGMKAHKHFQLSDPDFALRFLNEYDAFIKEQLKRS